MNMWGLAGVGMLLLTGAAAAETHLKVGYAPIAETEAVFAAQEIGAFKKEGLDVELIRVGPDSAAGLVGGSVSISSVPTSSFLQAVDNGLPLTVVSACGVTAPRTANSVALIARTGVTMSQPSDVIGKKIGVPGVGALLDVLFHRWLQQEKVNPGGITFVEVAIPNTVDVLRGGSVDGIVAGEPFVSRAVTAKVGTVAFNFMKDMPSGVPYSLMVATQDWVGGHAEALAAFRRAVAAGAELSRTDAARTQEIVAKYTGLPLEVVRSVELPECRTVPDAPAIDWLIGAMRDQKFVQTDLQAAALIAK